MLDNQTQAIVDNAMLTEYMIQYANRFRHSHVEIENAINKALVLFHREYDMKVRWKPYDSLNRIEAGAAARSKNPIRKKKSPLLLNTESIRRRGRDIVSAPFGHSL